MTFALLVLGLMMSSYLIFSRPRAATSRCWIAGFLVCAGCGSDGPVNIAPQFTLDGKPLVEASVSFIRSGGEAGRASFGVTDEQGTATLTTFEPNDGIMPGQYSVVVVKAPPNGVAYSIDDQDTSKADVLMKISAMQGAAPSPRRGKLVHTELPEIYADPGSTPLKCTVTPDSEAADLTFALSTKP